MKAIIKSLLLLSIISSIVSFAFSHTLIDFAKIFSVSVLVQFIIYNIYASIVLYINNINANKFTLAKIAEFSKQGVTVQCPCPRAVSAFVPIRLDQANYYKCLDCGKNVAVSIETKTYNQTDIIDSDSVMQNEFNKAKLELEKIDDIKRTRI